MLKLNSPLRGWCAPLDEVPDAVFAQRMLGDGIAIDPTSDTLHAPCAGEVISIAAGTIPARDIERANEAAYQVFSRYRHIIDEAVELERRYVRKG